MPKAIPPLHKNKKPFHQRNGSDSEELHAFEGASSFFEDANDTIRRKHYTREGVGRLSLDIPNNRRNLVPLQAMMMDHDQNPAMMIKNEKKYKQPSSPGGKLTHFLNSLFNQTSSKKSKSKSTASTPSMKDEDESPSGWRRKRSSISLFRSGTSNTNASNSTLVSDSNSASSRTPPPHHTPQAYKDLRSYSDHHMPACEIAKIPINESETHNKNEYLNIKSGFPEIKRSSGNELLDKIRVCDVKHDDHRQKYQPTVEIREFKRFNLHDDDGDSDSSSDLFELTNCDLGYYSSGLPVFETTHMDSIKRGAPISS